ncbi:MAG: hypothetical protein FJ098_03660, partial [Deltaproteobacteria bacterium]|nr:hypothetical protein [Deltaproteobacteria bacterium]
MGLGLLAACPLLVAVLAAPADDLRPPVGITSWVHFDGSTRAGSTRQEVSLAGGRVETRETSVYDLIVAKGLQVHIETDATITETLEGRPVTFRAVHTMQRRGTSTLAAVTFRTEGFLGEDGRIHAERRSSRSDQVETVVLDWGDDCCLYWGCDRLTRHLGHGPAG